MLVREFLKLAKAGYPVSDIKNLAGRTFAPGTLDNEENVKKLMHAVRKAPRVIFEESIQKFKDDRDAAIKAWGMPVLSDVEFESVVDFSAQTGERIKITVEDYAAYFDALLVEDNEDDVTLDIEVYSADKAKSFKAKLSSPARVERLRAGYSWAVGLSDVDLFYVLNYLVAVSDSSSDALDITLAEAVARGGAWYDASLYAGKLMSSKFADLFRDFFSVSQS